MGLFEAEGLHPPGLAPAATGRGIRVAVVDTGVNFAHPHLRIRGEGCAVAFGDDGRLEVRAGDFADGYGHGTCCAALIHRLAPDADLYAVRVTSERATTDAERIAQGIRASVEAGAAVISVALGTRTVLRAILDEAVAEALDAGAAVLAARPDGDVLPAGSPGALPVAVRDGVDVVFEGGVLYAEGRARPFGGGSNFSGPSLSTSRAAAALARWAESTSDRGRALARGFSNALG